MSSTRTRLTARLAVALVGPPLAFATAMVTAPAAMAGTDVDAANFSGGFSTTCSLPHNPEGNATGPYSCSHSAQSVTCAAVADTGPAGGYVRLCDARLAGSTSGSASQAYGSVYNCDNGSGSGTLYYKPNATSTTTLPIPVTLTVDGGLITFSGSYVRAGTGETVVARGTIPAVCMAATSMSEGFNGTVSPA